MSSNLIIELKKVLAEERWTQVISALRQDVLIWDALQDASFRDAAVMHLGSNPEAWSPANLALLKLDIAPNTAIQQLPPPELINKAENAYQLEKGSERQQPNLNQAGLLALALHSRSADWPTLPLTTPWQTALACLYGWVPDTQSLLDTLALPQAIHVILANPLEYTQQLDLLSARLVIAPPDEQQTSLQAIRAQRPKLATSLAGKSLKQTKKNHQHKSPRQLLGAVLFTAEKQALSNEFEQAQLSFDEVIETATHIKINAVLGAAQIEIQSGQPDEALIRWQKYAGETYQEHNAQLALAFIDHNYFEQADTILPDAQKETLPITQIAISRLKSQRGDHKSARQILEHILDTVEFPKNLIQEYWHHFLTALIKADLSSEVIRFASSYLQEHPNDTQTIRALTQAQQIAGTLEEALSYAQLSVVLAPKDIKLRRALAEGLEADDQWEAAFTERKIIIRQKIEPLPTDFHALAHCALHIGRAQQAMEISQQALLYNPKDGFAHTMAGKAMLALGQHQQAHEHLEQAIQLAPELSDPWLALAQDKMQANENKSALQTLKTASRAVPNNPQILFSLGEAYQAQGASTKALKAYRSAAELSEPTQGNAVQAILNAQIAYALGTTLKDLGHKSEAQQVFKDAHAAMPAKSAVAHAYGQMLIEQGRAKKALGPLALSKRNDPKNTAILIDYAQALLCVGKQPQEAENTLTELLALDPDHFQAKALLAEALEANGKNDAALDAFNLALSIETGQHAAWQHRLISGLGRVALALGHAETALAALEEAWEVSPQDPIIAKMLSEAFKINHLPQKALQMAKTALKLAPNNIDMLLWFTNLMTKLGFPSDAISTLDEAIIKQPDCAELYIQRGKLHLEDNNLNSAQHSFAELATMNDVTPENLKIAAEGLIACQSIADGAVCLERALELHKGELLSSDESNAGQQFYFELLTQLANAYSLLGKYQLAIEAIEQALTLEPTQASLIHQKGVLLLKLGRTNMAVDWNKKALEKLPDNAHLRLQAAHIQRALGNLLTSLEYAHETHHLAQQSQDQQCTLDAVTLSADLHMAMLNNDQSRVLLTQHADLPSSSNSETASIFYCLLGELAIRNNEEIAAANALTRALSFNEQHPRVLALQARMIRRQGDFSTGTTTLETALENFGRADKNYKAVTSTFIALAETALEFHAWGTALYLLEEATKIAPEEPLSHIILAQALVQQAEYQHLYRTLNINRHAPGDSALSKESFHRYDQAVLTASRLAEVLHNTNIHTALSTYLVRGQAIFKPDVEHAQALLDFAPTAENMAAYLTSLRVSDNSKEAAQAALELYQRDPIPNDPFLLCQIALVLSRKAPKVASSAAQKAVEESLRSHTPNPALYFALQAYVAHRVEDHATHLAAVQTLLTYWVDEPHWHARAADLLIDQQDLFGEGALEQAVTHLQQAAQLAPLDGNFQHRLGEVFLLMENPTDAISVLQKAVQLEPDSIPSRLILAKAFHISGDHNLAKKIAEEIAHDAPKDPESYLLLAKLALQENQDETALQYTEHILQTNHQHPEALLTKAEALTALKQYPEALVMFEAAITRNPQSKALRLQHVDLTQIVKGKQAVLKVLENYHTQYPDDIPLQIRLGEALADNGHREAAVNTAQQTLQVAELLTTNQQAQTLKLLAGLLRQSGQLDQAITHLNNAIDLNPQWSEPHLELGRTYQQRRQYDQALVSYQQAIALDPANPQPYQRAGMVLKDSKDYINAELMLRKAAKLDPKDVGIQRKLAAMIALNLVHHSHQPSTPMTTI